MPDLITADDPAATECTSGGLVDHDYRPHVKQTDCASSTHWRCVWCHVVSCGDYGEADPCIEPYHHRGSHRTRRGVTWPLGGDRPGVAGKWAK